MVALSAHAAGLEAGTQNGLHAGLQRTEAATRKPAILVLGDSLSAEYGLTRGAGWVELLRQRLNRDGFDYNVVNASISGETTSGGRSRVSGLLTQWHPAIAVIELGGNDALRGTPLSTTEANLRAMVEAARGAHARVVLVGMEIPPNYGPDYAQKFHAIYQNVAHRYDTALVPFLLQGIASQPAMFQPDQVHPVAAAQPILLDNVYPALRPLLVRR